MSLRTAIADTAMLLVYRHHGTRVEEGVYLPPRSLLIV
jgi:hypothetical protein